MVVAAFRQIVEPPLPVVLNEAPITVARGAEVAHPVPSLCMKPQQGVNFRALVEKSAPISTPFLKKHSGWFAIATQDSKNGQARRSLI